MLKIENPSKEESTVEDVQRKDLKDKNLVIGGALNSPLGLNQKKI